MKYKLVIEIDCPPGPLRPSWVTEQVGMKGFSLTSTFFGNWTYEKVVSSKAAGEKEGKLLFSKIKKFYPSKIRYASYDIKETVEEIK